MSVSEFFAAFGLLILLTLLAFAVGGWLLPPALAIFGLSLSFFQGVQLAVGIWVAGWLFRGNKES